MYLRFHIDLEITIKLNYLKQNTEIQSFCTNTTYYLLEVNCWHE